MAQLTSRRQRGAALLVAMIIVALVATLASAMVWQQWRAVQVETTERARQQSAWILNGASDWARLILREDAPTTDNLGEPWALPLQEARLSTFLAADKDNTTDDSGPEAFLSGSIVDAQSRYNLRNLAEVSGDNLASEIVRFERLLDSIGVNGASLGPLIANAMQAAFPKSAAAGAPGQAATTTSASAYLQPQTVEQLAWFGVDDDSITRMKPYITILPVATPVNMNTAGKEVLAAVTGMEIGAAQQLVQRRQSKPFDNVVGPLTDLMSGQNSSNTADVAARLSLNSSYFEVQGRLRLSDRVLEETSLMRRNQDRTVTMIRRRRESLRELTG